MSNVVIHNVLYLVSGYETECAISSTQTVLSASIPQLLESCSQPSRTSLVQWKRLSIPDTPNYWSTAASLRGCLLVVGGSTRTNISESSKVSSVHAYCPSSLSWVLVGELPQSLHGCITATLPTGELLVIGGVANQGWTKATYKCSLSM